MPKAGETPGDGLEPAARLRSRLRPARRWRASLDQRVHRLINDPAYGWKAVLERARRPPGSRSGARRSTPSRTPRASRRGPRPGRWPCSTSSTSRCRVARPYEGYIGYADAPARRSSTPASERSVLIDFLTPRRLVMEAIRTTYPGIEPGNVHVWTLGGPSRAPHRLAVGRVARARRAPGRGRLASSRRGIGGVHRVRHLRADVPRRPFTGPDGEPHLFIIDGYAASAEAIQAASLDPVLGNQTSMCLFSSQLRGLRTTASGTLMQLDPDDAGFAQRLAEHRSAASATPGGRSQTTAGSSATRADAGPAAGQARRSTADDFFPKKEWRRAWRWPATCSPTPTPAAPGVEQVRRAGSTASPRAPPPSTGSSRSPLTLRLMETFDRDAAGLLAAARPLLRGPGLPDPAGEDLRLRADPQRAPDALLGGARVPRRRRHPGPLRPGRRRRSCRRTRRRSSARCSPGTRSNHPIWFRWLEIA